MKTKKDLLKWYNKDYCLKQVTQNGQNLRYIKKPTKEICLAAFDQNPEAIDYIDIKKYLEIFEKYLFMKN